MPNLLPKGLWARIGPDRGTPVEPTSLHATIPGESSPRTVLEVWCSGPSGVPQLVWSSGPGAPTGVSATYNNNGKVTVAWTLPSTVNVDAWEVRRPDGTIVGTVIPSVTSLVDSAPKAQSGSYSVRGKLNGDYSTPAYSSTLNLTTGPTSVDATYSSGTGRATITWAAPSWGTPTQYAVYRGSTLLGYVAGTVTTYVDTSVFNGQLHTYTVTARINAETSGSGSDTLGIPALPPRNPFLVGPSFYYPERWSDTYGSGVYGHYFDWTQPAGGTWTGYEVQRFISGSWVAAGTTTARDDWGPYASSNTEQARVRTLSAGGPSDWATSTAHAPEY